MAVPARDRGAVLWLLADTIVTGEPLYSLTSTREVSGQLGRNRGVTTRSATSRATRAQRHDGHRRRRRPRAAARDVHPAPARGDPRRARACSGLLTFLIISAAGLSVIPRYMTIPSLLLSLCVAVALAGWTVIREGAMHKVAVGVAIFSVLVIGWRGLVLRRRSLHAQPAGQLRRDPAPAARRAARGPGGRDGAGALPARDRADPRADPDPALPHRAGQAGDPGDDPAGAAARARRPVHLAGLQLRAQHGPRALRPAARDGGESGRRGAAPGFERIAPRAGRWGGAATVRRRRIAQAPDARH